MHRMAQEEDARWKKLWKGKGTAVQKKKPKSATKKGGGGGVSGVSAEEEGVEASVLPGAVN